MSFRTARSVTLTGNDAINPRPGTQGGGGQFNSLFYVLPGMGQEPSTANPSVHQLPNQPFSIAYEPTAGPVQSNDWWTGVGLQWYVDQTNSGWAFSWNDGVIRSQRIHQRTLLLPVRRFQRWWWFTAAPSSAATRSAFMEPERDCSENQRD